MAKQVVPHTSKSKPLPVATSALPLVPDVVLPSMTADGNSLEDMLQVALATIASMSFEIMSGDSLALAIMGAERYYPKHWDTEKKKRIQKDLFALCNNIRTKNPISRMF